ncbi:hypothetical protein LINPERHAP1_LOCUS21142 [Linum perenne]
MILTSELPPTGMILFQT